MVVPVYNEAGNLQPLVEEIHAALGDRLAYEILMVDDGSSDETFRQDEWLKHALYNDDILTVVAEDAATGRVVGSASVNFSIGSYADLVGEFGRLVVDNGAKGMGVGSALMDKRLELVRERIHVGIVENRCTHPYSQRISHKFDFSPVGFLPQKHRFRSRESIALFARVFGPATEMRTVRFVPGR